MSASAATLGTHELLERVITYLPPTEIPRARQICKMWKQVIDRSKDIALARVLAPGRIWPMPEDKHILWYGKPAYRSSTPMQLYPLTSTPRPALRHCLAPTGEDVWTVHLHIPARALRGAAPKGFLTEPPITNVFVGYPFNCWKLCKLRSPTEITMRELYEVANALVDVNAEGYGRGSGFAVDVTFDVVGRRPGGDVRPVNVLTESFGLRG